MEEYLKSIFGDIRIEKADLVMPLYLKQQYDMYWLYIFEKKFVIMQLKADWPQITNVKKHITAVEKLCNVRTVLSLQYITPYIRKKLIQEKIQFFVPNKQLFMPYCAMDLGEIYSQPSKKTSAFTAKSQLLFIALCYDKNIAKYTYTLMADMLNTSKMTISRAVNELEMLGILKTINDGTSKNIHLYNEGKALFEQGKAFLISPVLKTVLAKKKDVKNMPIAGISALSELTMIADNSEVYALNNEIKKELQIYSDEYRSDSDIVSVELWKYDPQLFVKNNMVDFISLYASLKNSKDERVQMALEELEDNYKW